MVTQYLVVKFIHVLIAIVALGASAGLGILLEFYADDPKHGRFVLHAIERMVAFVVLPGYALMLFTGLRMMRLSWSLTTDGDCALVRRDCHLWIGTCHSSKANGVIRL